MTDHIAKGFRTAAFLSIAIVIPAGGCGQRSSTPENATTDSYEALRTQIGNQVTICGKFSLYGKFGPYVLLRNQKAVK